MFCPWDVINFIEDSYKKNLKGTLDLSNIQNYWSGSTSSPDTKLNRLEQEKLDEDIVIKALKAHKLLQSFNLGATFSKVLTLLGI